MGSTSSTPRAAPRATPLARVTGTKRLWGASPCSIAFAIALHGFHWSTWEISRRHGRWQNVFDFQLALSPEGSFSGGLPIPKMNFLNQDLKNMFKTICLSIQCRKKCRAGAERCRRAPPTTQDEYKKRKTKRVSTKLVKYTTSGPVEAVVRAR